MPQKILNNSLCSKPGSGTVNLEGGLPVFWGWATLQGVGHMCRIDGGIDGELHTSIL